MAHTTRSVLLILVLFFLDACATQRPLINVEKSPLGAPGTVTMAQVEKAIYRAAADRGWGVRRLAPGQLEAKIDRRSHVAEVRITYDTKTFSIFYKDSRNLEYDGTNIHRNYNRWIVNLKQSILRETSRLE